MKKIIANSSYAMIQDANGFAVVDREGFKGDEGVAYCYSRRWIVRRDKTIDDAFAAWDAKYSVA